MLTTYGAVWAQLQPACQGMQLFHSLEPPKVTSELLCPVSSFPVQERDDKLELAQWRANLIVACWRAQCVRRRGESVFSSSWRKDKTKRGPHWCFHLPDVGSIRKQSHIFSQGSQQNCKRQCHKLWQRIFQIDRSEEKPPRKWCSLEQGSKEPVPSLSSLTFKTSVNRALNNLI